MPVVEKKKQQPKCTCVEVELNVIVDGKKGWTNLMQTIRTSLVGTGASCATCGA